MPARSRLLGPGSTRPRSPGGPRGLLGGPGRVSQALEPARPLAGLDLDAIQHLPRIPWRGSGLPGQTDRRCENRSGQRPLLPAPARSPGPPLSPGHRPSTQRRRRTRRCGRGGTAGRCHGVPRAGGYHGTRGTMVRYPYHPRGPIYPGRRTSPGPLPNRSGLKALSPQGEALPPLEPHPIVEA